MIRQSLDADSAYIDVALHGDGLTSLEFREAWGAGTHEVQANLTAPRRIRIEKRGRYALMFLAAEGGDQEYSGPAERRAQGNPSRLGSQSAWSRFEARRAGLMVEDRIQKAPTAMSPARVAIPTARTIALQRLPFLVPSSMFTAHHAGTMISELSTGPQRIAMKPSLALWMAALVRSSAAYDGFVRREEIILYAANSGTSPNVWNWGVIRVAISPLWTVGRSPRH